MVGEVPVRVCLDELRDSTEPGAAQALARERRIALLGTAGVASGLVAVDGQDGDRRRGLELFEALIELVRMDEANRGRLGARFLEEAGSRTRSAPASNHPRASTAAERPSAVLLGGPGFRLLLRRGLPPIVLARTRRHLLDQAADLFPVRRAQRVPWVRRWVEPLPPLRAPKPSRSGRLRSLRPPERGAGVGWCDSRSGASLRSSLMACPWRTNVPAMAGPACPSSPHAPASRSARGAWAVRASAADWPRAAAIRPPPSAGAPFRPRE